MADDMNIDARQARNAALDRAAQARADATRDAEVEYSETVAKLRERFEADLSEALRRYLCAVKPAHQAYNAAVVCAEQTYAARERQLAHR